MNIKSSVEYLEDFNDMENKLYQENSGFSRSAMGFYLLPRADGKAAMEIRSFSSGDENLNGKVLQLFFGRLEITFNSSASHFSFWFINALKGFTVFAYDTKGNLIERIESPGNDHDNSSKEFKFEHTDIKKIAIVDPDGENMFIDHILLKR
ncbi:hypothetical protein [Pseudomonas sp. RT6P73]